MTIRIPKSRIKRIEIVYPEGLTMGEWYRRESDPPAYMINASLFTGSDRRPIGTVIKDSKVISDGGNGWGFGIKDGRPFFGGPWDESCEDYISGYPGTVKNGTLIPCGDYDRKVTEGVTNRSLLSETQDELWLTADRGTVDALSRELWEMGARNVINLDGGGSSRLMVGGLAVNFPTDDRRVPNFIAIWTKEVFSVRGTAKKRLPVYDAAGIEEKGRYIDKGDVCTFGEITPNLLIPVTYPISQGYRSAYLKSVEFFTRA